MEILENREQWQADFENGWLAHYKETGEFNWKLYPRPYNKTAPSGQGIDLSRSRLMLISSAGGYLSESQAPFDAPNPLGDYSIRVFPSSTPPDQISFAHDHYDHTAVKADQQVQLPMRHLQELVDEGIIGEIAPSIVSFMGYQPDATRVVDETFPPLLEQAQAEQIDTALLVPS
jgi:hypothetical protein